MKGSSDILSNLALHHNSQFRCRQPKEFHRQGVPKRRAFTGEGTFIGGFTYTYFLLQTRKLLDTYYPIEIDPHMTIAEKVPYMIEW